MDTSLTLSRLLPPPWRDVLAAIDRVIVRPRDLGAMGLGTLVGWWLYVPLHELLHAAGCLAAGGTVDRLELAPVYGGHFLAALLPWVVAVDGPYAGRLAGFATGGSDLVYLVTVIAPFVLTVPGIWLLRRAGRRQAALLVGLAVPFAAAPWLSLSGDAYEIGSILVSRLGPWRDWAELLRGDDIVLRGRAVAAAGADAMVVAGFVLAGLAGVVWAAVTSAVGGVLARWPGRERPLAASGAGGRPDTSSSRTSK